MGSKIKLAWVKYLLVFIFIFNVGKVFAQTCINPVNVSDSEKTIKVGISDSGFKTLLYNQIPIVATAQFFAYDKATHKLIAQFKPTDVAIVKFSSGNFEIDVNNKPVVKNLSGVVVFDSLQGILGVKDLKRNGKQALYHGVFELTPKNNSQFYLINVLDLQNYLKGVVPNEMPVRFGLEALKAQAVAARNYALLPRTKDIREFDVDDSVASQVYFGAGTESPLANEAVGQTDGLVALYGWNLILAQYCSTAGGYTENYENAFSDKNFFPAKQRPYLKGRPDIYSVAPLNREEEARLFYMSYPDSYDMRSPYYRWQREFAPDELKATLQKTLVAQSKTGFVKPEFKDGDVLGDIKELKVTRRGVSGKVMDLDIVTSTKTYHINKEIVIRRLLQKNWVSLPSANVVFDNQYDADKKLTKIIAYGGGFGHGVGMSQYGAGFMGSSLHKSFDKILKRYYAGITISTVPVILSENSGQKNLTQEFFTPYQSAFLVVDNKFQIKEFNANINGRDVTFELSTSLVPFNRYSRIDISSYLKKGKNSITFSFPDNISGKAIRLYVELVGKDDSEYSF